MVSKRTDAWAFPNGSTSTKTVGCVYNGSRRMIRELGPLSNVMFSYVSLGNITTAGRGAGITGESMKSFSYDSFGRMVFNEL